MKINFTQVYDILSGNGKKQLMENRLYLASVLMAIILSVICLLVNFTIHIPWVANVIIATGLLFLLGLYQQAIKHEKYHRNLFILISLLVLTFSWFYSAGINGPVNYIFIFSLVVFLSITPQKNHRWVLLTVLVNVVSIHLIAYFKPDLVTYYDAQALRYFDLFMMLIFVLVFLAIIYNALYTNYEEEKYLVEVQMTEIELQHKYMKDSINYARDIQQGILQKKESIIQYFNEYFIFWRPKDIVSGDFYIFKSPTNNPDKVLIAVADCTGHGVPGAFLTMIGMSFFNEIVLQGTSYQPNEILNELREKVKISLSQGRQASENRDGMDMVVCLVDKKAKTMQFAGSNRSVYLARKGKLMEYKGDRMPIGVHVNDNKPFSNFSIDLQDDDCIYLFTDGYADQYGGGDEKKYFISKFKKYLLKVSNKHMLEQGKLVKQNFDNWQGELEQTDDVLVVGLKPLA